ncbi:MAG: universal stress protein [Geminicoccaceae bacterium]
MPASILAAVDGSERSWKALGVAADLARARAAGLVIIHVVPIPSMNTAIKDYARAEAMPVEEEYARFQEDMGRTDKVAREAERRAREAGLSDVRSLTVEGDAVPTIVAAAAAEQPSAVVMGIHARPGLADIVLGGVAHRVARQLTCEVVLVK